MSVKTTATTVITLVLKQSKIDPEILDKVAGRAYTLDGVESVDATLVGTFKGESQHPPQLER